MLRKDNPYNLALEKSTIFMTFDVENSHVSLNAPVLEKISERNGKIKLNESRYSLEISHRHIDGRGLTYLMNELAKNNLRIRYDFNEENFSVAGFSVSAIGIESQSSKSNHDRTFTQKFIQLILESFPELVSENIGVVVNLESPNFESIDSIWGNSIAAIPIDGKQLSSYLNGPKEEWKTFLNDRAQRTVKILRKKQTGDSSYGSVLISSIGDLSNLPWASKSSHSSIRLGATPMNPRTLNIFVWSIGTAQRILLCGDPNHFLFVNREKVFETWKKALSA